MLKETLESLGLTSNETRIYLCLLSNADLSASEITSKTGIHRRNVYDALNRLEEKGLVNEASINHKKRFNAVHPNHLLDLITTQKNNVESILPQLVSQFDTVEKRNQVRVFRGIAGVRASFSESLGMLEKGDTIHIMGGINMPSMLGAFMKQHHQERERKHITTKILFNHQHKERAQQLSSRKNYFPRILPKDYYLPVQTVVYGKDIVCQILIHEEPFVIQVVDSQFASNYIKYFEMLWSFSKPLNSDKNKKNL